MVIRPNKPSPLINAISFPGLFATALISGAISTIGLSIPTLSFADAMTKGISQAVNESDLDFNLRYRYETVDQDGKPEDAAASTLRSRLTLTSGNVNGFQGLIQIDNVSYIGSEAFNNTNNGKTEYPVVADPSYTEINQVFLRYAVNPKNNVRTGRQRINHNNQRFLGSVSWRQNEQTFDAVRFKLTPADNFNIDYSYIWQVNRIFDPDSSKSDFEGDNHAVTASYKVADGHIFSAFAYLLDLDGVPSPDASSSTYGLEYKGSLKVSDYLSLGVDLSYAEQSDYKDNPIDYEADYYFGEVAAKFKPVTVAIGYEVLGADEGTKAFNTPLATGHKFQGFADKFLLTPGDGIKDGYLKIATHICEVKLTAIYHDFQAETGSADYGSEFDFVAAYEITDRYGVLFKYAAYDANDYATDTDKAWLMVTARF